MPFESATTEVPEEIPVTVTGLRAVVVLPLPNWPALAIPQHLICPVDNVAQLCESPAETETAFEMDETFTGDDLEVVLPSPSL